MSILKGIFVSILLLLTMLDISHAKNSEETIIPLVWNVPQASKNIIDRGNFIDKVRKQLSETPKNQVGKFYLSGPTGIGKTYIALTYANNYRNNYDVIYFFNSKMSMIEQLKKFNFELSELGKIFPATKSVNLNTSDDPDKIIYYSREFLRTTKLRWLLIFDNIDNTLNMAEFIPDHANSTHSHIILTSQAHNIDQNAIPAPLPTEAASLNFLTNEISTRNDKKQNILLLARALKNYPIALNQASSYLKRNSTISIDEYLKLLSIEEHQNPLKISEKAIFASVNVIQKTSQKAKKLLNMISCMHSKNIPGNLLKHWFINQQSDSYHDFTNAINLVTSYSLIVPKMENSDFFETHDFIQETIYNGLSNSEKIELNKSLINSLRAEFMKESKDIINPVFSEIIDHAKSAYERGMKENNTSDEFLSLLIDILEHNNTYKRDFSSSFCYITQISPIFESDQVKSREIKSRFFLTAARFFWRLGKTDECNKYLTKAEKITLPSDIEEYNRLKIYQSDLQIEVSNIKMAENHLNELEKYSAQNGYAKKQGSSAYYYLMVLHHMTLADFYNLKGDFDSALRNIDLGIQKATEYYKNKTGSEAPLSVMAPLYNTRNFSLTMRNDSNISAKSMLELIGQMEKTFNSNQHRFVSIAKIMHSKAIANENPNDAINQVLYSLQNLNQWFKGSDLNKDQVLAHLTLGNLYSKVNDLDKSIYHLTTALEISKKVFQDLRNTYVHETLDGLVVSYLKKEALHEAQNTYNMHKEIFLNSDPRNQSVYDLILNHYSIKEKL